tara:strand:- start:612 stop:920 length:309 start_codon:yes stop_codon:yes gene_type:complete
LSFHGLTPLLSEARACIHPFSDGNGGHVRIFFIELVHDQRAYLLTLRRTTLAKVTTIVEEAARQGGIMGVRSQSVRKKTKNPGPNASPAPPAMSVYSPAVWV